MSEEGFSSTKEILLTKQLITNGASVLEQTKALEIRPGMWCVSGKW